jgi:hypothetical protein
VCGVADVDPPVRSAGDVERENVRTHGAPPLVVEMTLVVQDGFEPSITGL